MEILLIRKQAVSLVAAVFKICLILSLAGNPRVMFDAIDIGCYECQSKPGFAIVVR